ncbi:hypothetical protein CRG98_037945 [Punica granatum]|uniref:RNase H type-1 domain-containing protein n=1 Tax=Punica granatum TaxID=22663 RepID=A0A2I0ICB4_PUNGR|nr:hypothetical protein CRG98_037945 [Punica granatum]
MDYLWQLQNSTKFTGNTVDPLQAANTVRKRTIEFENAWLHRSIMNFNNRKLGSHRLVFTFDVAITNSSAHLSVVCRDNRGSLKFAWAFPSNTIDPLRGEAEAALHAIHCAHSLRPRDMLLLGDCKDLLDCLSSQGTPTDPSILSILNDMLVGLSAFDSWDALCIPRDDNYVTLVFEINLIQQSKWMI